MTRPPRVVPVEDVREGDHLFHAGSLWEVHRVQERPGSGIALVVTRGLGTWVSPGRRLFYKLGEHVEVVR